MPPSPKIIVDTLTRSFGIGIATGLRSQAPGLALALAARDGGLARGSGPLWTAIRSDRAVPVAALALLGESVGDKLPITPSRLAGGSPIFRLLSGAGAGALIANGLGARSGGLPFAALAGAAGAAVGTWGGYHARHAIVQATGLPDLPFALIEDVTAWTVARLATARQL